MSTSTPQSPPGSSYPPQQQPGQPSDLTPARRRDNRLIIGMLLLFFGLLLLGGTLLGWSLVGILIVPALGLVLAVWGSVSRRAGLIIPGGIVLGVGIGALLVDQAFAQASGAEQGAVALLSLALGFAIITPLTWAFTERMHWWPLIPGAVLALVGFSLVAGDWGAQVLIWLGRLWPVALIIAGAILLWNFLRKR